MSKKALAFFPWWAVNQEMAIGPVRLLPYDRRKLPGNRGYATQADIDAVLKGYADRPRSIVKQATLVEVDDWQQGDDPEPALKRLFAAREAIAFSALSERSLFRGHFTYCCFDNFALIVQRYEEGRADRFNYTTRRRDGGMSNLWSTDEFAFQRPLHVHDASRTPLNPGLICLLMGDIQPRWLEAVAEFNRANTDASEVLPHVELVMMKSAFELLFEIRETAHAFVHALDRCLDGIDPPATPHGPLSARWSQARPKAIRPIHAWAREFCDRRGVAAHGGGRGGDRFVWSEWSHLAFASILFPLLFKKVAADSHMLQISADDVERLRRVDEYVLHDPSANDGDSLHPWTRIENDVRHARIARCLYAEYGEGQ